MENIIEVYLRCHPRVITKFLDLDPSVRENFSCPFSFNSSIIICAFCGSFDHIIKNYPLNLFLPSRELKDVKCPDYFEVYSKCQKWSEEWTLGCLTSDQIMKKYLEGFLGRILSKFKFLEQYDQDKTIYLWSDLEFERIFRFVYLKSEVDLSSIFDMNFFNQKSNGSTLILPDPLPTTVGKKYCIFCKTQDHFLQECSISLYFFIEEVIYCSKCNLRGHFSFGCLGFEIENRAFLDI
jgi:hypothetical protein